MVVNSKGVLFPVEFGNKVASSIPRRWPFVNIRCRTRIRGRAALPSPATMSSGIPIIPAVILAGSIPSGKVTEGRHRRLGRSHIASRRFTMIL
jgi:hypothetical protein